jgi:hypothetical protein
MSLVLSVSFKCLPGRTRPAGPGHDCANRIVGYPTTGHPGSQQWRATISPTVDHPAPSGVRGPPPAKGANFEISTRAASMSRSPNTPTPDQRAGPGLLPALRIRETLDDSRPTRGRGVSAEVTYRQGWSTTSAVGSRAGPWPGLDAVRGPAMASCYARAYRPRRERRPPVVLASASTRTSDRGGWRS